MNKGKKCSGYALGLRHRLLLLAAVCLPVLASNAVAAMDEEQPPLDKSLYGIKFGVLAYIDYSSGVFPLPGEDEESYNRFALTRGHFTVRKSFTDWMAMRLTADIKQESGAPGSGLDGSYVSRLKYLYVELSSPDFGPFTDMKAEIGMGHMPWLDFEEHNLDYYRCQGTMPVERAHVFNSADIGVSLRGNLGGKLENAVEKTGNRHYDGRYGSWHIGVYNGGGYHAVEENENKVVEARLSIRPLPDILPGLQFSAFGLFGDGNRDQGDVVSGILLEEPPGFIVTLYMASFEHPYFNANFQLFSTLGNQAGEWIQPDGEALKTRGWSGFLRTAVPGTGTRASLFGRYDRFDIDPEDQWAEDSAYSMIIAGVSFDIHENNLLVLAWEGTDYGEDADIKGGLPIEDNRLGREEKVQVVWQIEF